MVRSRATAASAGGSPWRRTCLIAIDSAWERLGNPTTAAFRRVEAYADAHCESGQAK
jgi:hypothetical protein